MTTLCCSWQRLAFLWLLFLYTHDVRKKSNWQYYIQMQLQSLLYAVLNWILNLVNLEATVVIRIPVFLSLPLHIRWLHECSEWKQCLGGKYTIHLKCFVSSAAASGRERYSGSRGSPLIFTPSSKNGLHYRRERTQFIDESVILNDVTVMSSFVNAVRVDCDFAFTSSIKMIHAKNNENLLVRFSGKLCIEAEKRTHTYLS